MIYNSNIYDGEYADDTLPALPPVKATVKDAPKGDFCFHSDLASSKICWMISSHTT